AIPVLLVATIALALDVPGGVSWVAAPVAIAVAVVTYLGFALRDERRHAARAVASHRQFADELCTGIGRLAAEADELRAAVARERSFREALFQFASPAAVLATDLRGTI